MELTYDHLNTDELQATSQADCLIAFDAALSVVIGEAALPA